MKVEQAIYGATRGGHSLLAVSGASSIAEEIATRLDLPDTAPPGVEWSPYISGFPYKGVYVLARTILDTQAKRGGIVFAHAFLAPLEEIAELNDLQTLVSWLSHEPFHSDVLEPIDISMNGGGLAPHGKEFIAAANALTTRAPAPTVYLGVDGFEKLITDLWSRLWPGMRRRFAFRLSFSPNDLTELPKPSLVCTPHNLSARWNGHNVISIPQTPEPASVAASILVGSTERRRLLDFAAEFGLELNSLSDLTLMVEAQQLSESNDKLDELIAVARFVEKLSTHADMGATRKDQLLRDILRLVALAQPTEILLLRNLRISQIKGSELLWQEVERWMKHNLYQQADDHQYIGIIENALKEGAAVEEWRDAILSGIHESGRSSNLNFHHAFWRWITLRPKMCARLLDTFPSGSAFEDGLWTAIPDQIEVKTANSLLKSCEARKWLKLHGAIASAAFSCADAITQQLMIDSDQSFFEGLRSAIRFGSLMQIIECAVSSGDKRLVLLAAEIVAKGPGTLAKTDFSNPYIQNIWAQALIITPESWKAPENPSDACTVILNGLLDSSIVNHDLISELSNTPLADLSEYPRRAELWSVLKGSVANRFLLATAHGWMRKVFAGQEKEPIETAVQNALLEDARLYNQLNALVPDEFSVGLTLITLLPTFPELRFIEWIAFALTRVRRFNHGDSDYIGRIVVERRWVSAAGHLIRAYKAGREDLRPALLACVDMLSAWTRFRLALTPTSAEKKWQVLVDVVSDLYPWGPNDREIWERAGGKNKDIRHHGDGRTRWHDALNKVRNGSGMPINHLLKEMRGDFPTNEKLQYLAEDSEFGGSRH
ncbi:MAG TPA: effector-associated domain EAD1-containing protein [Candidatus Angelobacter sp.]|nr:effector-associated domain EAD1-containing protein [Candidatus Angelobacter sp.]